MGWGFRKSFRLGKGIRINLSRSGVGVSVGVRGFRIGIGPRGPYSSVSAGGFIYRTGLGRSRRTSSESSAGGSGTDGAGRGGGDAASSSRAPRAGSRGSALGCLTLVLLVAALATLFAFKRYHPEPDAGPLRPGVLPSFGFLHGGTSESASSSPVSPSQRRP